MKKMLLAATMVLLLAGLLPAHALANVAALDFGDAPEGTLVWAYPSLGVMGSFPTCMNVPTAGWIDHTNFGAWFGPLVDFEGEGNGGICPSFVPYDNDECFMDGDAGLLFPQAYTITAPTGPAAVVPCPTGQAQPALGATCQTALWGGNIDIDVHNTMPNHPTYLPAYVNVLIDWDQGGSWGGASTCVTPSDAPEHVLVDFLVPPLFIGPLSALGPPPFTIGPNSGYVWARFSITEAPVGPDWNGEGMFEDGESEDYLLLVDPDQGDVPTIYPDISTECPIDVTTCPIISTQCTDQPDLTVCNTQETWCPVVPTECQMTECFTHDTECPIEPTSCPEIPTIQPEIFTECPVIETMCGGSPGGVTTCSQYPTFCEDAILTFCPLDPTFCTQGTTFCPFEWTNCPGGFTLCPEIPTVCPDSTPTVCKVTECPADQTLCATGPPTACPTAITYCEDIATLCFITECPIPLTECHVPECDQPTILPGDLTQCPTRWTFCPDEPTWCPVVKTICPDEPTFCTLAGVPTTCPTGDFTWCPEDPTLCSQTDTWCPANLPTVCEVTVFPITPTFCPVDPTNCPLIDSDGDGIDDCNDNCPNHPNGPNGGTCTIGTVGNPCSTPGPNTIECGTNGYCSMNQEDTRPTGGNGCGDACECEGDLTGEGSVNGLDTVEYLKDLPRNPFDHPCTNLDPCMGDLNCDGSVNGLDTLIYLDDLPRNPFSNPCPPCSRNGFPCVYPP